MAPDSAVLTPLLSILIASATLGLILVRPRNLREPLAAAGAMVALGLITPLGAAGAAIVGIDLGPNLTMVGSFGTMLWLLLLPRRGITISVWVYSRVGLLVTPPAQLAALAALLVTRGG